MFSRRGDEEDEGGDDPAAQGGSLCARPVHGGRSLGHQRQLHRRQLPEGSPSADASHVHQSSDAGQGGPEVSVRVSGVQDEGAWANLYLDFQLEDTGQAVQVGSGRSCPPPANLMHAMRDAHNAIKCNIPPV